MRVISSYIGLFFLILFLSGCMLRIAIEDNCDTVTGIKPDQIPDVVTALKETPEGDIVTPNAVIEEINP